MVRVSVVSFKHRRSQILQVDEVKQSVNALESVPSDAAIEGYLRLSDEHLPRD